MQPAAQRIYGQPVRSIRHFGSYSCRRLYGRSQGDFSEHATADAIDIAAFQLKDGRRFTMYGTEWGDGVYRDQHGSEYSVDSGTIGCILLSDIMAEKYDDIQRLGSIVEITEDFSTGGGRGTKEWDGVIHIGPIHIETSPEYEDYE